MCLMCHFAYKTLRCATLSWQLGASANKVASTGPMIASRGGQGIGSGNEKVPSSQDFKMPTVYLDGELRNKADPKILRAGRAEVNRNAQKRNNVI